MSGWCPSFSVWGMAVVCTAAVPPGAVVRLVPYSSRCSAGEYCCHVVHCSLPGVWCVGEYLSVVFVQWGVLCPCPPSLWWWVGLSLGGGWHSGWWGGMVRKGGCVAGLPVLCVVSPFCSRGVPVEWRGGACVWCPIFVLGPAPCVVLSPLCCPVPLVLCVVDGGSAVECVMNGGACVVYRCELCSVTLFPRPRVSVVTALLV